jgi:hypothetical protein
VKPTHGSQWIWIHDGTKPLDLASLQRTAEEWMRTDYYSRSREWAYRGAKRRLLVEEYLEVDGEAAPDYRMFCFDGVLRFVEVVYGRFTNHEENHYDRDWTLLDFCWGGYPVCRHPRPRPRHFERMVEVAERLAAGMDFVRVDLYHLDDGVRFGEMSTNHSRGLLAFDPVEWDAEFGRHWRLRTRGGGATLKAAPDLHPAHR